MTKDDYRRELEGLFDFDEQIRSVCDIKTNVTIQENVVLNDDGLIHVFYGLRKDPLKFYVEETGAYCFINSDVCLMACRGLIWVTHEMYIDDYEPTPDEARAIKAAAAELGFDDMDTIDFHSAVVDVAAVDSLVTRYVAEPIRLH
jgi:hypothetical protein